MNRLWRILVTILGLAGTQVACGQSLPPNVVNGLNWLTAQMQTDGSLANEGASLATPFQNRTQAAQTFKLLSSIPSSLVTAIGNETDDSTEYLARQAIALIASGQSASTQLTTLTARQNSDGGFGGALLYISNPLDTAWTVLALANAGQGASPAAVQARALLASQQANDGGIDANNLGMRLEVSAIALMALNTGTESTATSAASNLSHWLLTQQGADGSWMSDTYLTALAWLALAPNTSDPAIAMAVSGYLGVKQGSDGSWQGDPFVTALALSAFQARLGTGTVTTGTVTTATVVGQIVDSSSNLPLSGVALALNGTSIANGITDDTGRFRIANLPGGGYAMQMSRTGYASASATLSVNSGQTLDSGVTALTPIATSGIVRGQVTATTSGAALAGATVAITGSANLSTTTDVTGKYEFTGVTPGAITLAASLTGYQTATATATVVGGQTLVFSPGLYLASEIQASSGTFKGKTVASGSGATLPGVAINVNGNRLTVSGADGTFSLTLAPGSYSVVYSLTGYASAGANFALTGGSTVDAGIVALNAQPTSSSLSGKVTDTSNQPIAGATVQLIGGANATTAADGSYALMNLVGNSFDLRVSATGYTSQTFTLTATQPGNFSHDFALAPASSSIFQIDALSIIPAAPTANTDVSVTTTVTNIGQSDAMAIPQLVIIDTAGLQDSPGAIVGRAIPYDLEGTLLGQLQLAPGASMAVKFLWNTGRSAAGSYQLDARLIAPGSLSTATPNGQILLDRSASLAITPQLHFTGSVTANPPVLRAGLNTSVQLSAVIQNDGNQPLPAQNYILNIYNVATNTVVSSQTVAGPALAISDLTTLAFSNWIPTAGGNYRLEVTSVADAAQGRVTNALYVGDAATATYTVNKLVVPTGTQTVRGTVSVTGQDVTTGVISDPLAGVIKTAVQRAMSYNYAASVSETLRDRCNRCHVQSEAFVGGERTRKLINYSTFASNIEILFNLFTNNQRRDGGISGYSPSGGYPDDLPQLGMWALNAWHNPSEIASTLAKEATYLVGRQTGTGTWNWGTTRFAWWTIPVAEAGLNVKNLVDVSATLRSLPAGSPVAYSEIPLVNHGLAYVRGSTGVLVVKTDGTTQSYMSTGGCAANGIVFAADGTPYASTSCGLWRRNADATETKISTLVGRGLALGPDGNLYMTNGSKVVKLTTSGVASDYITGLGTPTGISFNANGDLIVADTGALNVRRYVRDPVSGAVVSNTIVIGWAAGNGGVVNTLIAVPNGIYVSANTGLFFYNTDWHGERLLYDNITYVTTSADGSVVVRNDSTGKISGLKTTALDTAAFYSSIDTAIARGTNYLLNDANTNNNDMMSVSMRLIGLNAAKGYYQGQPMATTLQTKMNAVGSLLRSRVNANGGWGRYPGWNSDSLVTAEVGVALDTLNPSPSDPIVRNAINWLLSRQHADGTWYSEDGIMDTPLATTTWVSVWLATMADRLGAIDTTLSVTFSANVTMANPDLAPTTVTANGDGSSTAQWSLIGVTSAGRSINYDLTLANMALNEARPVSTDAHLTFKNSFDGSLVTAPIAIPRVTASAFLGLGVTTDQTSYGPNSLVTITAQATNTGASALSGSVKLDIFAPDNTLVNTIGILPFTQLAAGASTNLPAAWNTGQLVAANGYYILATLLDAQGNVVGTAKIAFDITTGALGAAVVTSALTTDKSSYLPTDTVRLTSRVINATANQPLSNLSVMTTVTAPDSSMLFAKTETVAQLLPNNLQDYSYSVPLAMAAAGTYMANLTVQDANGNTLSSNTTSFTVQSSATTGAGLTGTVSATPKEVPIGNTLTLISTVKNQGNAALANVPLTISIIDPVAQRVITSFASNQTLARGGVFATSNSWTTAGTVNSTYVAVLSATVGGNMLTLAQDSFKLAPPPIKLDISQTLMTASRVLAMVSCSDSENDSLDSDIAPSPCITARVTLIDQALTGLGISHTIVHGATAFQQALRTGFYNTYWISGKQSKLNDSVIGELREAVYAGDSLLLDGDHDQRNSTLDAVMGIAYRGKYGPMNLSVQLDAPLFTAQTQLTSGRSTKFDLAGSSQQATLMNGGAVMGVGIANHSYGKGRSMIAAFDWPASYAIQPLWQPILGQALQSLLQPVDPNAILIPDGFVDLAVHIVNQGQATPLDVKTLLPAGALYLGATPSATANSQANSVDWTFNLPVAATQDLMLTFAAPSASGTLSTQVSSVNNGAATPYGNPLTLNLTVTGATASATSAQAALQALSLTRNPDKNLRNGMVAELNDAMSHFAANTQAGYAAAIADLVDITGNLGNLPVDTTAIHLALDRVLKEAQTRWSLLQPIQ